MQHAIGLVLVAAASVACKGPDLDRSAAQVALGQRLFEDAALSSDGTTSCATCHAPAHAFSDGKAVPAGVHRRTGTRNAPSLLDLNDRTSFFWDGRETTLEHVVLQPITNAVEMGQPDRKALLHRVREDRAYRVAFARAFGDVDVDDAHVASALAAFVRSLPRAPSRYDLYATAPQRAPLTQDERDGLVLFNGHAGCSQCHVTAGPKAPFTDNQFHHTGIGFDRIAGNIGPLLAKLDAMQRQGRVIGNVVLTDRDVAELGHFAVTRSPADLGAFRTPSLRNVAITAPYMHDGSIPTLQAAVEREIYYRSLERGQPIELTVPEQQQLMAFLQTLTEPQPTPHPPR